MTSHSHFGRRVGSAPLAIQIGRPEAGAVRVSVSGEVDLSTATRLRESLARVVDEHGAERLDVDLSEVTFLDSSGVSALLAAQALATDAGWDFAVVNPQPPVRRVLAVTAVLERLGVPPEG
jgi:anti-anti-sigma factor